MQPSSESEHQMAVMAWAEAQAKAGRVALRLLHHIPNGEQRTKLAGIKLKQMGVKAGIPDLFLPVPIGIWHGLYIEMKAGTGAPSVAQRWWLAELTKQGYRTYVARGHQDAKDAIDRYLAGEPVGPGLRMRSKPTSKYVTAPKRARSVA